jgi:hypothetical protein
MATSGVRAVDAAPMSGSSGDSTMVTVQRYHGIQVMAVLVNGTCGFTRPISVFSVFRGPMT